MAIGAASSWGRCRCTTSDRRASAPPQRHGRHHYPLADVHQHPRADDLHTVAQLAGWQAVRETRGQHGDMVAALRQRQGFTLGVDSQAGIMRPVIR